VPRVATHAVLEWGVLKRTPELVFGSPRSLPKPSKLDGQVVVLDIAFAATSGGGVSFESVTLPFIEGLGGRLAMWVDHHDHERHVDYASDNRFKLATKAEHGACPEMITPEMVRQAGPVDTIVCHVDLDGLYSAAKWILEGREPYKGADVDAHRVDTRIGKPGPIASRVDRGLRALFRDYPLKRAIVLWLVEGMRNGPYNDTIDEAAAEFAKRDAGTNDLASKYVERGRVVYCDVGANPMLFDKTDLLLLGQERAEISVVRDSGMVTIAARYDSGWDFLKVLGLEGGMPTRVTVPEARLQEAIDAINAAPAPTSKA